MKIRYGNCGRAMNGPFVGYPKSVIMKFNDYHKNNLEVFNLFRKYAMEMQNSGREHYSAEIIINKIRWHQDITTTGSVFKISNDFKPLYARLLVYLYPEFENFFKFREVTSRGVKSKEERSLEMQNL